MTIYATTVFLSAFLLLLVQPILAKYILPWFGGGPGVWTTCLLFFQVLLTAGYGLSHLLANKLAPRRQAAAILALLLLTVALLPITPSKAGLPENISAPTWHIIRLLAASVGSCAPPIGLPGPVRTHFEYRSKDAIPDEFADIHLVAIRSLL